MFTLRIVNTGTVVPCDDVQCIIKSQLQGDIVAGEFDVGFLSDGHVISIWTPADPQEPWADVWVGKKIVLWCDGLKDKVTDSAPTVTYKKRKQSDDMESDSDEDAN